MKQFYIFALAVMLLSLSNATQAQTTTTIKETNDAFTSVGMGIITANGNRPAAYTTADMAGLLNNHLSGNTIVNYIGSDVSDLDPWNPGLRTAMRFALPASSLTISSVKLRIKVVDVVGSPVATLVSTDDNNWIQTDNNFTSSFPFTTNSVTLASNVSITAANANAWKEFDVTSYVSSKTSSSSATDITLIFSGNASGDNYFNFVADDQLTNDANAQIAELVITYAASTPAPSALSYASSPVVATINTTNISASPTVTGTVVSYSISPALPAGVNLNTTTGVISGTPTLLSVQTDYTVTATNTGGNTNATFRLTVNAIAPTALSYPSSPVVATINTTNISANPTVTGTVDSYGIVPALPAGVTLNTTTGVISGTPTVLSSQTDYTVTATNTGGSTNATFRLTVNAIAPTALSYASSPVVATINTTNISASPTVTGTVDSYGIVPALPAGVTLNTTTGVISGTPTVLSSQTDYTVTATNTGGNTNATFRLTVNAATPAAPSALSYASSPVVATINTTNISASPTVTGNVVSYSISPALPSGVTLNTTTGVISGTPTVLSSQTDYTVTATNTGGSTNATFRLTVNAIAPTALSYASSPVVATINTTNISASPTVTGTVVSYGISPALPAGVTLNTTTGVISGTPTVASPLTNYTVTATNGGGSTTATFTLTVHGIPTITTGHNSVTTFSTTQGIPSVSQYFTVSGTDLANDVVVTPPTGFEVSTDNVTFSSTLTLPQSGGGVTGQPVSVYVRLSSTATIGSHGTKVNLTSTGASSTSVDVSGTVIVPPTPPTNLSYSPTPVVITVNTTSVSSSPTVTGTVSLYSISPALPAGVTIDPSTGVISGVPIVVSPLTAYTITATNGGGSTTASFKLTVNPAAPSSLSYSPNPVVATVNTTSVSSSPTVTGTVVSYSISPALPTGVTINTTTGVISGTPTVVLPLTNYTVTATNGGGSTTATFTLTVKNVAPSNLSYSPNPVITTINTTSVSSTPTVTGTVDTYSVSPALPAGVTLNTTTGVISGIPTVVSVLTVYTITATNGGGSTTATFTLTVKNVAPSNLSYSPNPVTATVSTTNVNSVPTVTGGVDSYSISPALPAGVILNTTTGVISGIPTVISVSTVYTITATNTIGSITATFTLTVKAIAPTTLSYSPNPVVATINTTNVSASPTVTGVIVSYSISPTLPAGVTLNTTTGVISGTPMVLSTLTNYTITATNTGGSTTATFTLTVNPVAPKNLSYLPSPVITTVNTTSISSSPTVTGTVDTYSVSPALPAGVILNPSTGVISGIPTVVTVLTNYTITATNAGGSTTAIFTLTVKNVAPSNLSYASNPIVAIINTTEVKSIPTVTGGNITYSVGPALPAGLTIDPATGVFSGIPTELLPATDYTVTATNETGSTTCKVTITVDNIPSLTTSAGTTGAVIGDVNGVVIDPAVTINTIDHLIPINKATVFISAGFISSEDAVTYPVEMYGVKGTYDAALGILTLSGTATVGQYQDIFRTIRYKNSNANAAVSTRSFTFSLGFAQAIKTLSLKKIPAPNVTNPNQAFCGSGTVSDLVATAPTGSSVRWWDAATGGNLLASTTDLVTTKTYYAETWDGTSASLGRIAVMVMINTIPAQPVIVPTSSAKNKIKLCPGDNIACSNFDNALSYQWRLNETDLAGQTANHYKVPVGGAGNYTLYVKNQTTGCDITSATVAVDVYTVTTPVIYEKKKSDYISILIVDNRSNLYSSYLWTYSDGTALPSTIVNDRQFLVLPPTNMAATYMVNITDTNACKVTSAIKAVTLKTIAAKAYPTMNNGNFMVSLTDAQEGKLNVRIFNQNGILQKVYSFENVSSEFEYQVNAAGLKTGSYTVEISLGDYVQTQKIIIQ